MTGCLSVGRRPAPPALPVPVPRRPTAAGGDPRPAGPPAAGRAAPRPAGPPAALPLARRLPYLRGPGCQRSAPSRGRRSPRPRPAAILPFAYRRDTRGRTRTRTPTHTKETSAARRCQDPSVCRSEAGNVAALKRRDRSRFALLTVFPIGPVQTPALPRTKGGQEASPGRARRVPGAPKMPEVLSAN